MEKQLITKVKTLRTSFTIDQIISIERMIEVTPLPLSSNYFVGMGRIREKVIPIIDMNEVLFNQKSEEKDSTRLILVEGIGLQLALMVDEANEIIEVKDEDIQPLPEMNDNPMFNGVFKSKEMLVSMINLDGLMNGLSDIQSIKEQVNQTNII